MAVEEGGGGLPGPEGRRGRGGGRRRASQTRYLCGVPLGVPASPLSRGCRKPTAALAPASARGGRAKRRSHFLGGEVKPQRGGPGTARCGGRAGRAEGSSLPGEAAGWRRSARLAPRPRPRSGFWDLLLLAPSIFPCRPSCPPSQMRAWATDSGLIATSWRGKTIKY